MSNPAPITLAALFRYWRGLPYQVAAITELEADLAANGYAVAMRRDRDWFRTWSTDGKQADELVTMAQATAVFGRPPTATQLADLNACLQRFDITTPARIRHFLAQVGHESGGLRWMLELASGDAYNGRADLGNTQAGDGPRFRGAGALQITGRYNYQRLADALGDPDVMEGAVYVASRYPFTSAGFWWQQNSINDLIDAGATVRKVSARVNGRDPANGLADREGYFTRAVAAIPMGLQVQQPAPVMPPPAGGTNPLPVPYFAQLDSATDQARRMCFSSSCAMLLAFLRPGLLHGPNGDDQYLARVRTFGDTTSAIAQVQALGSYEVRAEFTKQANFTAMERSIDAGIPVPCGYLHRGPVDAPSGGGHWLIVVGYDATHLIVHDPLGEANLITGDTLPKPARFCRYSRLNFGRRWMVEGSGSGWAIIATR
jgi:putative chitinase